MKKKLIAILIIIALIITALLIPAKTYQRWFGKIPIEDEQNYDYYQIVYLKNPQGLLAGVKVPVEIIADDQIVQKWELLTKKISSIPSGYSSPINSAAELIEYRLDENKLVLTVSDDFLLSEGRATIEAIAWTFINEEIKEVVIYVGDEKINELNNYRFQRILKKNGINLKFETQYLFEAIATTIIYNTEDYLLPVTYFHLEKNVCDYIIKRTIFENCDIEEEAVYNYIVTSDVIVINLLTTDSMDEFTLATISDSIKENFDVSRLTINGSNLVLHEAVFKSN